MLKRIDHKGVDRTARQVAAVSIPYDPRFRRSDAHFGYLYAGNSIAALSSLVQRKGYVAWIQSRGKQRLLRKARSRRSVCNYNRRYDADAQSLWRRAHARGTFSYAGGVERAELVDERPLSNVRTGQRVTLREPETINTPRWSIG